MTPADERLNEELDAAEAKAWTALARYKFLMFGYWAGVWVHLNRIARGGRPNPWRTLVQHARGPAETGSAEREERRNGVDSQTGETGQETGQETDQETTRAFPRPEEIAGMATMVTQYLGARDPEKERRSGHMIYEDGLIAVRVNKFSENITISILRNRENSPVFEAYHRHRNQPNRYNPGGWTRHLEKLADRAQGIQEEKEAAQAEEKRLEEQKLFGAVDDSDLFPDGQDPEQRPANTPGREQKPPRA